MNFPIEVDMIEHAHALTLVFAAMALTLGPSPTSLAETPSDSPTARVEVIVTGIDSDAGTIVLAIVESAEQYDAGDTFFRGDAKVPITNGTARRVFDGVPHGTYAIKVFHDENGNGELDTNFVGFPKEGFGFSNDAMGAFGPPSFEQAAFEVDEPVVRHAIKLQ